MSTWWWWCLYVDFLKVMLPKLVVCLPKWVTLNIQEWRFQLRKRNNKIQWNHEDTNPCMKYEFKFKFSKRDMIQEWYVVTKRHCASDNASPGEVRKSIELQGRSILETLSVRNLQISIIQRKRCIESHWNLTDNRHITIASFNRRHKPGEIVAFIEWDEGTAGAIIADHATQDGAMLPLLHALQETFGYIPEAAISMIAHGWTCRAPRFTA